MISLASFERHHSVQWMILFLGGVHDSKANSR